MKKRIIDFHFGIISCLAIGFGALIVILQAVSGLVWQMILIAFLVLVLIKGYSLQHLVDTHDLTGLLSRRKLYRELRILYRNRRERIRASLLFIDFDDFKRINDAVGQLGGDKVIRRVSMEIKKNVYGKDLVANFGGDEIVVVFLEAPRQKNVQKAAEKIRFAVANLTNCKNLFDVQHPITISIGGVALRNKRLKSLEDLLSIAEAAAKKAKSQGGNRTIFFDQHGNYVPL